MKRIHGIMAFVVLFVMASSFAFCSEAQCAKKDKHKAEAAVSENAVSDETDGAEETSDASEDEDAGAVVSGDETPADTVSGDNVYTKKQKAWLNKVMVKTDSFIPVYSKANDDSDIVGRMYPNSVAKVKKIGKKFTKVKSGATKGYILNDDCIYGTDALAHKKEKKKEDREFALCGIRTPLIEYTEDEVKLLAAIIYCEGGYEIYDGQVAVGAVVLNRVLSTSFPNTIEDVIYQKYQFGPASSGLLEKALQGDIKESCLQAAEDALYGVDPTKGAFYFRRVGYTDGIEIGNHVFF